MKHYLADLHNGTFAEYETEYDAFKAYNECIADALISEYDLQDETGFTDQEIVERVKSFYVILDEITIKLYQ